MKILLSQERITINQLALDQGFPNNFEKFIFASNTYFGPMDVGPGKNKLVKVEILISDSPDTGGMQIVEVQFNDQSIPLKPRGIDGRRGSASFQVLPGKYQLKWVVNRDNFAWPRNINKEAEVDVDPRDLWVQIEITGETVSIH